MFEDQDQINTMASQTWGAISLGPTGNLQGTYKFFCLTTGRVTKRQQFAELPMPGSILRKVEEWDGGRDVEHLVFSDRTGTPYPWREEVDMAGNTNKGKITDETKFPGVLVEGGSETQEEFEENDDDWEQAMWAAKNANLDTEQPQITFGRRYNTPRENALIQEILAPGNRNLEEDGIEGLADNVPEETKAEDQTRGRGVDAEDRVVQEPGQPLPETRRSTRRNRGRQNTQRYAAEFQSDDDIDGADLPTLGNEEQEIIPLTNDKIDEHVMGLFMTQYAWPTGLRHFKENGDAAMTDELGKLHNMQTFIPVNQSEMSEEDKRKTDKSLMFLKEKRDQTIRG